MTDLREPVLGRRRGGRWTKLSHGLYKPATDISGRHEDLMGWRLVLPPSAGFTHLTAAEEFGWWLPPVPEDLPVLVSMNDRESRPQRDGLLVTRHARPPAATMRGGLPLVPAAEALLACARDLRLLDMVVLTDAALHMGTCSPDELRDVASQRRRGAPMLRRALRLADGRSESAWESMLRMLHEACDVRVQPQFEVFDDSGLLLGRADLWIKGTRALQEYDGADHLKRPRQRKDLQRGRRLGNSDWMRRGYTSQDVLMQGIGILRDADAALGRSHRPDRIRVWNALLMDSLFTPSGTERFRRLWGSPRRETGGDRSPRSA
jgi:hypothetical protein